MGKFWMVVLTLLLAAAAFFLPGQLTEWEDERLLDVPHITSQEEREGFAESLQLTVGEKLLLLHSGALVSMTPGGAMVQGLYTTPSGGGSKGRIEHTAVLSQIEEVVGPDATETVYNNSSVYTEIEPGAAEETLRLWDQRLETVWAEIRTLQSMGGLPELWPAGSALEYTGGRETLYVDSASQVSFQVYTIQFSCAPYSLEMTLDSQSERVLSFALSWVAGTQLNWGINGAASFGPAWRDYWKLENVSSSWYSNYIKDILECPEEVLRSNGAYNSNGRILFSYDSQSLSIDLHNWVYIGHSGMLRWNS